MAKVKVYRGKSVKKTTMRKNSESKSETLAKKPHKVGFRRGSGRLQKIVVDIDDKGRVKDAENVIKVPFRLKEARYLVKVDEHWKPKAYVANPYCFVMPTSSPDRNRRFKGYSSARSIGDLIGNDDARDIGGSDGTGGGPTDPFTICILLVDWFGEDAAIQKNILGLLNKYDQKTGGAFNITLPGYKSLSVNNPLDATRKKVFPSKPAFPLARTNEIYFFDKIDYDKYVRMLETEYGIKNLADGPKIILIEIDPAHCNGEPLYQKKLIVDINKIGIEHCGDVFDAIIEASNETTDLTFFRKRLVWKAFKSGLIEIIINILDNKWRDNLSYLIKTLKYVKEIPKK